MAVEFADWGHGNSAIAACQTPGVPRRTPLRAPTCSSSFSRRILRFFRRHKPQAVVHFESVSLTALARYRFWCFTRSTIESNIHGWPLNGAEWRARSPKPHLLAFAVAFAMTACLLVIFISHTTSRGLAIESRPRPVTMYITAPVPAKYEPPSDNRRTTRRSSATRVRSSVRRAFPASLAFPEPVQNQPVYEAAISAAPATNAASSPLRLDLETVRRAAVGTEGALHLLARTNGVGADGLRSSHPTRLSSAMDRTAVADCLAGNAAGSLLSAPQIVLGALILLCHKSSFSLALPQQGHWPIRAIRA